MASACLGPRVFWAIRKVGGLSSGVPSQVSVHVQSESVRPPTYPWNMLDTNDSGARGQQFDALDLDHFDADRECPFEDVGVPEVLVDDPWFAGIDAALDRVADVDPGVLERLAALPPDASLIARLVAVDRAVMSPEDAVTFTVVVERAMSWLASLQDDAILAAGSGHIQVQELLVLDPRPDRYGERHVRIEDAIREEIAAATRWSLNHAHDRLVQARLLAAGLPRDEDCAGQGPDHPGARAGPRPAGQAAAVRRGGPRRRRERSETARVHEACAEFEARVLPAAQRGTVGQARAAGAAGGAGDRR